MKYIIKESQINNVVFWYLNSQDFVQTEVGLYSILFFNSESDGYAQIRYDKDDGWCGINRHLAVEISSYFSLGLYESAQVIINWVEDTLKVKVADSNILAVENFHLLKIPV